MAKKVTTKAKTPSIKMSMKMKDGEVKKMKSRMRKMKSTY